MEQPDESIRVEFWQNGGNGLAEFLDDSIPLFSKSLIEALAEVGIDNLQTYRVKIVERTGKAVEKKYYAVNILGVVSCANMSKSQFTDGGGTGMITMNFRQLVIDEAKTQGLLMFRLAESVSSVIVHEEVKKHLELKGFKYLRFQPLDGSF